MSLLCDISLGRETSDGLQVSEMETAADFSEPQIIGIVL